MSNFNQIIFLFLWICSFVYNSIADASGSLLMVGYVSNWAQYRGANNPECSAYSYTLGTIDATQYTHLIYAFFELQSDFTVIPGPDSKNVSSEMAAAKAKNPAVKIMYSLGGWNFNENPATQTIFSNLAASPVNRATFIKSALSLAHQYGFDGIDIDWEYPGDVTRGGQVADNSNFVLLLSELRAAIQSYGMQCLISIAAPGGDAAQKYDFANIVKYVDFINLMTYDIHGTWENQVNYNAPFTAPQGEMSVESIITKYLNTYQVPAHLINMGIPMYGTTWSVSGQATSTLKKRQDIEFSDNIDIHYNGIRNIIEVRIIPSNPTESTPLPLDNPNYSNFYFDSASGKPTSVPTTLTTTESQPSNMNSYSNSYPGYSTTTSTASTTQRQTNNNIYTPNNIQNNVVDNPTSNNLASEVTPLSTAAVSSVENLYATLKQGSILPVGSQGTPGSLGKCIIDAGTIAFFELMPLLESGNAVANMSDPSQGAAAMVNNFWVSFETSQTIQVKVDYIKQMGLGGVMVWAVDMDTADFAFSKVLKSALN